MHPPAPLPTPGYDAPDNRPRFGWRTNVWDWPTTNDRLNEVLAARAGFAVNGWDFAGDQLDFYLECNPEGTTYTIKDSDMGKVISSNNMQTACIPGAMLIIKAEAARAVEQNDSLYDTNMELTTDWLPAGSSADDGNIHNALGHYWMSIGADVSVKRPSDGGVASALITPKLYVHDFYYFHGTVKGVVGEELDSACVWLEEAGKARSYRVDGEAFLDRRVETL